MKVEVNEHNVDKAWRIEPETEYFSNRWYDYHYLGSAFGNPRVFIKLNTPMSPYCSYLALGRLPPIPVVPRMLTYRLRFSPSLLHLHWSLPCKDP